MNFSINYKQRPANFRMKEPHFHNGYEIYYLLEGHRTFFINHSIYSLCPHSMVLIPKLEIHRTTDINPIKHSRYVIYFDEDILMQVSNTLPINWKQLCTDSPFWQIPESCQAELKRILDCAIQEFSQNNIGRDLLLKNYLELFLVKLIRLRMETQKQGLQISSNKEIERAAAYITQNFSAPITLDEVAGVVNLSPSYFSHKFHTETGFRFKEYLNQVRLRHAANLLMQTKESITAIALECGFESSNYFGDLFAKTFGCSPREYRIRHRK